jgi:hypothetical protein
MITEEQYMEAIRVIEQYEYEQKVEFEPEDEEEFFGDGDQPCSVCGEIGGMVNQCCPGYDPLHFKNCGYG